MSLDTDFHAYLDSLTTAPVQENVMSENQTQPRVWWQRTSGDVELLTGGNTMIVDTTYDVEVYGLDVDAAATIADTLKSTLHGHRGVMGSSQVLAMFVEEHSDDYIPKNLDSDEGFHVFSFRTRILN